MDKELELIKIKAQLFDLDEYYKVQRNELIQQAIKLSQEISKEKTE